MKCKFLFLVLIIILVFGAQSVAQTIPAFPTAEGYGKWVTGGRGGRVIHVTNLDDIDRRGNVIAGSFRAAMETPGSEPITIVFDVSGIIELGGEIRVKRDNVTIAGQTAPGDGICLKGASVNLGGSSNLIIRHMRFRVGTGDSFIGGACLNIENAGSFIVDHCSFSWSAEENIGMYNNQPFTVQWCISAEGLYNAGHPKGARSYGAVMGGEKATYHHNLLAHNKSRSPRFGTSDKNDINVLIEYINNVNFNWGGQEACYGGENEIGAAGTVDINFINNYYRPGPAYPGTRVTHFVRPTYEVGLTGTYYTKWHIDGNYMEGSANESFNTDNWLGVNIEEYVANVPSVTKDDLKSERHEVPYPINIETAEQALQSVMQKCGALPWDAFDTRIMHELKTGTVTNGGTGIIDKPSDSGGYPEYKTYNLVEDKDQDGIGDYWEEANGLDPANAEDQKNLTSSGYTYLEAYINGIVGEQLANLVYPEPVYLLPEDTTTEILAVSSPDNPIKVYIDADRLYIKIHKGEPLKSFSIYNMGGQKIQISQRNHESFDISTLAKGVYVVHVEANSGLYSVKFVR